MSNYRFSVFTSISGLLRFHGKAEKKGNKNVVACAVLEKFTAGRWRRGEGRTGGSEEWGWGLLLLMVVEPSRGDG